VASPDGHASATATVGATPLRRLGKTELHNTLLDLFPGLPANFDANVGVPADNDIQLAFSLPGSVSDLEAKRFMDLAEATIAALGANAPGNQVTCTGSDQTACARAFVTSFGKRAFRRPLDPVEVDDLTALYTKLRADPQMNYGFPDAINLVVEAMLQAPGFLYRWERGLAAPQLDGALVKFDSYEMASRLSYFLWKSMPDAALLAAADAGKLSTPDGVAEQATRLLMDPRADGAFGDFITQWLELHPLQDSLKDAASYPAFKPALLNSMQAETVAFARDVLRGSSPTFAALLTAPYTFVDVPLAQYYGLKPDATGRVDLTGTPRLGLLTQGALMAVKGNSYRTSPVRRGKFILNRLLCTIVPAPPPNVVTQLPPPDPSKTVRQQMAAHRSSPSCAACHTLMDGLGFAFEHFDGAGNYQANDRGNPIDASGSVIIGGLPTLSFQDASDLAKALASLPAAHECFVRQWLRYAIDRFEQDADAPAVAHLASSYEGSQLDTRNLIVEITRTLPFTHRAPAQGEVLAP
jgi:Protein of unknown function (DUF1592)/Protein of unknown function (DUF1588)/Protein of unknown function (DUF1595)/Protein of unknown function (DUF1585)